LFCQGEVHDPVAFRVRIVANPDGKASRTFSLGLPFAAMFIQLPCLGVKCSLSFSAMRRAFSAGNAS
jgi:hypothetical protein